MTPPRTSAAPLPPTLVEPIAPCARKRCQPEEMADLALDGLRTHVP